MENDGLRKEQKESKRSPGSGLINQLIILPLIPALIVGGFMTIMLVREFDAKKQAEQIKSIADYMVVANQVVHQLQRECGSSSGYIASNGSNMKDTMEKQRLLTDRYYTAMEGGTKSSDMAKLGYEFARCVNAASKKLWDLPYIREKITSLTIGNNESNELYTEIIGDIIGTFQEASIVIKDSKLSFPFTACVNLIMAKEMASSERAIMTGFVAEDKPVTQSEMSAWMQVSKGQDALLAAFKYQATKDILKEFQ
ncbi:MAG: nitrate- and nitrite sensing domain-containing protein, partial [Gammaproteobacteria bacterium]|nr:nitrate- and nitrite sensing domain-containing protein [Gammaproteobacteria bacterium]